MADKIKIIIISKDGALARELNGILAAMAEIEVITNVRESYNHIKEQNPRLLLLDIRGDIETAFDLAGRVKRFLPDTLTFIINDAKDPDLIIRSLKTGAADFIVLPVDESSLPASIKFALEKDTNRDRQGEIIVLSSNKGGQGVATLSVNLAGHIRSLTNGRVLIVDLKLQTGDVSLFLDLESTYTVADLVKDIPRLDENLLFSSIVRSSTGLYVLTAPEKIDETMQITTENISRMFRILKEHMDYIIVDVAHEFTGLTAPVMDLAERVLLVSQQTVPSLRGVRETLDLFETVGYEKNRIEIIVNRYEKGNEIRQEEMERLFEQKKFAIVSNDYSAVTDSINKGKLLSADHEGSPANRDIAAIAVSLTGIKEKNDRLNNWELIKKFFHRFRKDKTTGKGNLK